MQMDYSLPIALLCILLSLYCLLALINSPPTSAQTQAPTHTHLLLFILFSTLRIIPIVQIKSNEKQFIIVLGEASKAGYKSAFSQITDRNPRPRRSLKAILHPVILLRKSKTSPQMKPSSSPNGQSVWKLHTWLGSMQTSEFTQWKDFPQTASWASGSEQHTTVVQLFNTVLKHHLYQWFPTFFPCDPLIQSSIFF